MARIYAIIGIYIYIFLAIHRSVNVVNVSTSKYPPNVVVFLPCMQILENATLGERRRFL